MANPAPQAIIGILARGPASSGELTQALRVTQPTISRLLRTLERSGQVVRLGTTRGARYGLTREVGPVGRSWPLYRIDESGTPEEIASVHAIERERFFVRGGPPRVQGSFEGIPYYLQDARPAGFLGRAIPAAYPELGLPPRVVDWTDAHVLTYLTQRGSESVGNLIIGAEALNRYLAAEHGPRIVSIENRPIAYPAMATDAMFGAPPGSSAHGEHPKFSVRLGIGGSLVHMLVKFSPPRTDALGVRWADLLIAEHLASVVLEEHGISAARSELLEYAGQVFLQSERFDRVGDDGRRGVASLASVSLAFHGEIDAWPAAALRLRTDGLLVAEDAERLVLLDTFGALIANTDRHFGNITLFDHYEGTFALAPAYDMLPMLFAPQDGQVLDRSFTPPVPTAASLPVWPRARELAEVYWARLTGDTRLSEDFRGRSALALEAVRALPSRGSPRTRVA
jgi:DNA-binding transcriptional ArsR family regulator